MTVTLRLTPAHVQVLALVRDGQIKWRASTGPFGGFALADGSRIEPSIELVALYELCNAGLITVNKPPVKSHQRRNWTPHQQARNDPTPHHARNTPRQLSIGAM